MEAAGAAAARATGASPHIYPVAPNTLTIIYFHRFASLNFRQYCRTLLLRIDD